MLFLNIFAFLLPTGLGGKVHRGSFHSGVYAVVTDVKKNTRQGCYHVDFSDPLMTQYAIRRMAGKEEGTLTAQPETAMKMTGNKPATTGRTKSRFVISPFSLLWETLCL